MFKNSPLADCRQACFITTVLFGATFAASVAFAVEPQMEEVHAHVEGSAEKIIGRSFTGPMVESTLQYHVRYDDLDLASDDGAETLRKRVKDAARKSCADLDTWNSNLGRDLSCIAAANKSAKLQVDYAIKLAVASKQALASK